LLLAELTLTAALLLPTALGAAATAAGARAPWMRWSTTAITALITTMLLAKVAHQLAAAWPARAVESCRRARLRTGGTWWTVSNLACLEDDPVSAAYLVHAALAYADEQGVGAVTAARTPTLHRTYLRYGFTPDPDRPAVLVRPPRPARSAPGYQTSTACGPAWTRRAADRVRLRPPVRARPGRIRARR
jgi:hypothetical protein